MGKVGEKLEVEFIISTGDNFYDNGLTGVNDPAFQQSFTNIYKAPSLQKPWYTGSFFPFFQFLFILYFFIILSSKKHK